MNKQFQTMECCPQKNLCASCFLPDICKEHFQLSNRQARFFKNSSRISRLAAPKYQTVKFRPMCVCKFPREIEMIKMEKPRTTRTDQLSYPQVRKLLPFKDEYRNVLSYDRLAVINRCIRKSLFSLYSRLGNVQPPKVRIPIYKWTRMDWKHHWKYLCKLSQPKQAPRKPRMESNWKPIKEMKRYKKLARPKVRKEHGQPQWVLTDGLKNYKPSQRILNLGKHKARTEDIHYQDLPVEISPLALKYKISPRVKELSEPHKVRLGESDLKENPFGISPYALKAKTTQRLIDLAVPREFEENHIRQNPFAISPAALTAKASVRTIELAKPRGS